MRLFKENKLKPLKSLKKYIWENNKVLEKKKWWSTLFWQNMFNSFFWNLFPPRNTITKQNSYGNKVHWIIHIFIKLCSNFCFFLFWFFPLTPLISVRLPAAWILEPNWGQERGGYLRTILTKQNGNTYPRWATIRRMIMLFPPPGRMMRSSVTTDVLSPPASIMPVMSAAPSVTISLLRYVHWFVAAYGWVVRFWIWLPSVSQFHSLSWWGWWPFSVIVLTR